MQRIIVKNFGPLKDIDLEIKDYMIFLGPQASGKSTLAKLIYGFKEVIGKNADNFDLWDLVIHQNKFTLEYKIKNWEFAIKNYFYSILQNYHNYEIEYTFNKSVSIIITEKKGIIIVKLSKEFTDKLSKISNKVIHEVNALIKNDSDIWEDIIDYQEIIQSKVQNVTNEYFLDNSLLFIPDDRNVINSTPSHFYHIVKVNKRYFLDGFKSVELYVRNTNKSFEVKIFNIIKTLFQKILKGDFENIDGGRISLPDGTKIPLDLASSGQKEAIGILLILTIKILKKSRDFYVIEEPEAHLFPEAQKDITYLISLLANQEGNQVIITTHSHYILGALNILINAHRIGQTNPEEVEKIVPRELWVDKNRIFAGFLENGIIKDIYDDEAEMIKIQQLNAVAGEINKDFDRLLDLEFANENV